MYFLIWVSHSPTFTKHPLSRPPLLPLFSAGDPKINVSQLLPSRSSLWWAREITDQIITTNYNSYCDEQEHEVLRKHRGEVPAKTRGYYIKEDFLEKGTPELSLKGRM